MVLKIALTAALALGCADAVNQPLRRYRSRAEKLDDAPVFLEDEIPKPDLIKDVNGKTAPQIEPSGEFWLFKERPTSDNPICYMSGSKPAKYPVSDKRPKGQGCAIRKFAASRDKGHRYHSGVDLYYPPGTQVFAPESGEVVRIKHFYLGVCAVMFKTDNDFTINFGEVDCEDAVKRWAPHLVYDKTKHATWRFSSGETMNTRVEAGEVIGQVGTMDGLSISMVHLEMYDEGDRPRQSWIKSTSSKGKKVTKGFNSHLRDPTKYLLDIVQSGTLPTPPKPVQEHTHGGASVEMMD